MPLVFSVSCASSEPAGSLPRAARPASYTVVVSPPAAGITGSGGVASPIVIVSVVTLVSPSASLIVYVNTSFTSPGVPGLRW